MEHVAILSAVSLRLVGALGICGKHICSMEVAARGHFVRPPDVSRKALTDELFFFRPPDIYSVSQKSSPS